MKLPRFLAILATPLFLFSGVANSQDLPCKEAINQAGAFVINPIDDRMVYTFDKGFCQQFDHFLASGNGEFCKESDGIHICLRENRPAARSAGGNWVFAHDVDFMREIIENDALCAKGVKPKENDEAELKEAGVGDTTIAHSYDFSAKTIIVTFGICMKGAAGLEFNEIIVVDSK
jgi:hypothetical protein